MYALGHTLVHLLAHLTDLVMESTLEGAEVCFETGFKWTCAFESPRAVNPYSSVAWQHLLWQKLCGIPGSKSREVSPYEQHETSVSRLFGELVLSSKDMAPDDFKLAQTLFVHEQLFSDTNHPFKN